MKRKSNFILGTGLLATVLSANSMVVRAEEVKTDAPAAAPAPASNSLLSAESYTPIWGEAMTLPAKVLRFRVPVVYATGSTGYTSKGKAQNSGLTASVVANYTVFEYGVTDAISVQALLPNVISSELTMDKTNFRKSEVYKKKYEEYARKAANIAVNNASINPGGSLSADTIFAAIMAKNDGQKTLAAPLDVPVGNGEKITLSGTITVSDEIDKLITNAATPKAGRTGIGDLELGALFNLINPNVGLLRNYEWAKNFPLNFSIGSGFRLPTGQFKDVPQAQRATSRGTLDFAVRTNLDLMVRKNLAFSWQHQMERALKDAKRCASSLLNPDRCLVSNDILDSTFDASTFEYERTFKRKGMRHMGFLQVGYGFGDLDMDYNWLSGTARYTYELGGATTLGAETMSDPYRQDGFSFSLSVDGLALKKRIPLQFGTELNIPMTGKNVSVATVQSINTIRLFYRF